MYMCAHIFIQCAYPMYKYMYMPYITLGRIVQLWYSLVLALLILSLVFLKSLIVGVVFFLGHPV